RARLLCPGHRVIVRCRRAVSKPRSARGITRVGVRSARVGRARSSISLKGTGTLLTIFSIPKPFRGHIGTIQRNAIQSWLQLSPRCEVILYGNDPGVAEAAAAHVVKHTSHITRKAH